MRSLRPSKWIPVAMGCVVSLGTFNALGDTVFVDGTVLSSGDGSSWALAKKTVQEGIDAANSGDEVWVRGGMIYKPGTSVFSTFTLKDGVNLHGGFNGTETQRTQADPYVNLTYLSGDNINGMGDDAYHVVTATNTIEPITRLDGFILVSGDARDDSSFDKGGGLLVIGNAASTDIALNVTRCRFENNFAIDGGAVAVWRNGGPSFTTVVVELTNCEFTGNEADVNGGALWVSGSKAIVTNSLFVSNEADVNGGAVYLDQRCRDDEDITECNEYLCFSGVNTSAILQNCTIAQNTAGVFGGGVFSEFGILPSQVRTSIVWDNEDGSSTSIEKEQIAQTFYCEVLNPLSARYSNVQDLDFYVGPGNIGDNLTDHDPDFVGSGDFRLLAGSPCIDTGEVSGEFPFDLLDFDRDTVTSGELAPDLAVNPWRIFAAAIDMGAYEFTVLPESCIGDCVENQSLLPPRRTC